MKGNNQERERLTDESAEIGTDIQILGARPFPSDRSPERERESVCVRERESVCE